MSKVVDVPGLGYIHNALAAFAKQAREDGQEEVARQFAHQADDAEMVYSHIATLGRYESDVVSYQDRGVALANFLMEMGWEPPAFIPTSEWEVPF
jgi:hypothetical protein